MSILWEVVKDLGDFAYTSVAGTPKKVAKGRTFSPTVPVREPEDKKTHTLSMRTHELPVSIENNDLDAAILPGAELVGESTFRSVSDIMTERQDKAPAKGTRATPTFAEPLEFAGAAITVTGNTPLYKRPTKEFDTVMATVHAGVSYEALEMKGQWVCVRHGGELLWIHREDLTDQPGVVQPLFVIKEYCSPESPNTKKVRNIINDMYSAGRAELPLRGEEYVTYKLSKEGIKLPLVIERPRVAGTWAEIYKGNGGVHIGVRPKKGAILEYVEDEEGRLAYVEAVFPDESISVSEVGSPTDGYYNERTFTKEAWQALAPVFLQFT